MGLFSSFVKGLGGVKGAVGSAYTSLHDAVTGRGQPGQAPMSSTTPAGSAVEPCPATDARACPGVLSAAGQQRANAKYDTLTLAGKQTMKIALNGAQSPCEKAYIWKAFAACHTPDECLTFGRTIAGKSDNWMKDNLSLTGDTHGRGVQQQWSHSCNATTAQALRGQMDPIYALETRDRNPHMGTVDGLDATRENPALAEEQRRMLTSNYTGGLGAMGGGTAVGRDQAGGSGRWADDLFNKSSDATGVTYSTMNPAADPTTQLDTGLATGAPVPIVIGNAPGEYTHYVLVTGSDAGPPKTYTVHDPWDGVTVTRTPAQMNGHINLAGSNQITAVEEPTAIARPAGRAPC